MIQRLRRSVWPIVLLSIYGVMLAWGAWRQAPTIDEPMHLDSGVRIWRSRSFDTDKGNPPFLKLIAGWPVALVGGGDAGVYLLDEAGARIFWWVTLGRWSCLPFGLLGGYLCYRWACDLHGQRGGVFALVLWVCNPEMIGNGQLITGDMAATSTGLASTYLFRAWLLHPGWKGASAWGICLGIAMATKFVNLIYLPMFVVLWIGWRAGRGPHSAGFAKTREIGEAALGLFLCLAAIHAAYLGQGMLRPLRASQIGSEIAQRTGSILGIDRETSSATIGRLPSFLPQPYLEGIDAIRNLFDSQPLNYLGGTWHEGSVWYYYLYGIAFKTPLGLLVLWELALIVQLFQPDKRASFRECFLLITPPVMILTFVTVTTQTQAFRYVLPIFPYLFIWSSQLARTLPPRFSLLGSLVGVAVAWAVVSSLRIYPYSGSYFNEAAGGPRRGHEALVGDCIDWGQDLHSLKWWMDRHPDSYPMRVAYFGIVDPTLAGIKSYQSKSFLEPGWYAISVGSLRGYNSPYAAFLDLTPIDMVGYSIYIYHVTPEQSKLARRSLEFDH